MRDPPCELRLKLNTQTNAKERIERVPHRKQTPEVPQRICQSALWVFSENCDMNKLDLIFVPDRSAMYFN